MIGILFNGLKFGIVLAFLIGPVFFTIIQASIERGFWVGVLVALGVSLSDFIYVVVCYFGLSSFVDQPGVKTYMGWASGIILIGFGLYHLVIKSRRRDYSNPGMVRERKPIMYMAKGFLINSMSPMVPLFWIGAVGIATIDFGYSTTGHFVLFFGGVLVTVLATDIGKAYLAGKLRELITNRLIRIMNVVVGVALLAFGGRLIMAAIGA